MDGNGWKVVVDGYFGYLMDFHGFPIAFFVYSEKCGNDSHDFGFLICITATFSSAPSLSPAASPLK